MSGQPVYFVDSFTDRPFAGNPAAVCPLMPGFIPDEKQMQDIAAEMNLAETAFVTLPISEGRAEFGLRWFTPTVEVELCGHATLAAAHILWTTGAVDPCEEIGFHTASGRLTAAQNGSKIVLDFPSEPCVQTQIPNLPAFLETPKFTGKNRLDWLVELEDEQAVTSLVPDFEAIRPLGKRGLIVTARSDSSAHDFVSRFFAPQSGIPEDPVTGSAHCCLGPYWAERLGRDKVTGYQASKRGGVVGVTMRGDRALLEGAAVTTMEGILRCP